MCLNISSLIVTITRYRTLVYNDINKRLSPEYLAVNQKFQRLLKINQQLPISWRLIWIPWVFKEQKGSTKTTPRIQFLASFKVKSVHNYSIRKCTLHFPKTLFIWQRMQIMECKLTFTLQVSFDFFFCFFFVSRYKRDQLRYLKVKVQVQNDNVQYYY